MKINTNKAITRLCLAVLLVLAFTMTSCSKPIAGNATPAPKETTVNIPDVSTGDSATTAPAVDSSATATVQPPSDQPTTGDYPDMPATPVITVTIEAYPTP
jgi:hypothetical protein